MFFGFRNKEQNFSRENFNEALSNNEMRDLLNKKIYKLGTQLQNSNQSLNEGARVLQAVIAYEEDPHFFFTVSNAEHRQPDLENAFFEDSINYDPTFYKNRANLALKSRLCS